MIGRRATSWRTSRICSTLMFCPLLPPLPALSVPPPSLRALRVKPLTLPAVEGLGEEEGGGVLADRLGADEEVGVADPVQREGAGEGCLGVFLPDQHQ